MDARSRHGILNPRAGATQFTLERRAPCAELADVVDWYWIVRWALTSARPFPQATLPHPCVNVVMGTHRPGVHGVALERFVAQLEGTGWVFGVKFRPGGFFPFYGRDLAELTGVTKAISTLFGPSGAAMDKAVVSAAGDDTRVAIVERFLRERRAPGDEAAVELAVRAVEIARADASLALARDLATRVDRSERALERLFRRYVGVSPKWVIRRFRVHEACERIAEGAPPCWSALAQDLGYFDQAHFIRDFKSQVGCTPSRYASACSTAGVPARLR